MAERSGAEPVVHRHRVGHHRRLRRSDPAPDLPVRPRPRRRRRCHRGAGGRARSACTPTSPATTSTSSRPAATSRSGQRPHRRRRRRPPVEALPRRRRRDRPSSRCAATISCCRCSAGRSTLLPPTRPSRWPSRSAQEYGRAMAAGFTGEALAAGQRSLRSAMQAVADALDGPRLRRPRREPQRPAADHQQPLPVRRCGHRAPGDLRRRPRHGQGHARRARRRRRRRVTTESSRPAATRSAPPPSDVRGSAPGTSGFADRRRGA